MQGGFTNFRAFPPPKPNFFVVPECLLPSLTQCFKVFQQTLIMAWSKKRRRKKKPRTATNSAPSLSILPLPPLSEDEERDLLHLERRVERAFYEAGTSLGEIRDRRLFRNSHATFEEYCRERFNFTRQAANNLIAGASVFEILTTNGCQILPTAERQVRPITSLDEDEQVIAWSAAVEEAGNRVPSSRVVKEVVRRIKDKEGVPTPFQVGEVCQIIAKDNPELRGKSGCWCIISEVYEFSCLVHTWDNEYTLHPQHLKTLGYSTEECSKIEIIGERMTTLYETGKLDDAALWILNGLARIKQPSLTDLQEKLLSFLEKEYEI